MSETDRSETAAPAVGSPLGLGLIHISWAGPERWLSAGGKQWVFEDHRYCGPIVLCNKTREPATNEPPESHSFWQHVNAWYQQGKRTQKVGGKVWCMYETPLQQARKQARLKPPNVGIEARP